jgi:hypothetical protein
MDLDFGGRSMLSHSTHDFGVLFFTVGKLLMYIF